MFSQSGSEYFNPDEAARRILIANPSLTQSEANSLAWHEGKRLLERAIAERCNFAFETTLGGHTITRLLDNALSAGIEVRIWYVSLRSPELHIARVQARAARGGHSIPEATIRARYNSSRLNLIHLLPAATEVLVYDNSGEANPHTGKAPQPMLVAHIMRGRIVSSCKLSLTPEWAKPIMAVAMKR
jgi:predicted ABC-type ATPase